MRNFAQHTTFRRALSVGFLVIALPLAPSGLWRAVAEDPPEGADVVRVEEDWELVLNVPDGDMNAPQFHTVMSPRYGTAYEYVQVSWNYRELPDFFSGGLQLQTWLGDENQDFQDVEQDPLSLDAETVTWTQRLEADGAHLTLTVFNGESSTWGPFGSEETRIQLPSSVAHLNLYTTNTTKRSSWVSFGSNRVNMLVIREVRKYGRDGLISRDTTPVIVFRNDESNGN